MATKKRRRALSADEKSWTAADRAAIQQSRVNAQSPRYHRENAAEKDYARARPLEPTK